MRSFTDWLTNQEGRDDPVGDLARDKAQDRYWPTTGSVQVYRSHLDSMNAVPNALDALDRAWTEYQAYRTRERTLTASSPSRHEHRAARPCPDE
jgi:hypothetical protein